MTAGTVPAVTERHIEMTEEEKKNCIFLIGFMGSGKTTVGRVLARRMNAKLLDTDDMIEKAEGMKISEIFSRRGEAYFRDLETETMRRLRSLTGQKDAEDGMGKTVISVGGGLPVREVNRSLMHACGTTIFLTATEETLVGRLKGSKNRPLLQGVDLSERIRSLTAARLACYLDAADYRVCTDDAAPEEIAERIMALPGIS